MHEKVIVNCISNSKTRKEYFFSEPTSFIRPSHSTSDMYRKSRGNGEGEWETTWVKWDGEGCWRRLMEAERGGQEEQELGKWQALTRSYGP